MNHYGERSRSDGDGISIFGATNIWIDHIFMSNCDDGIIDAIQGSTAITVSNCHFTRHNEVTSTIIIQTYKKNTLFSLGFINGNEFVFMHAGDAFWCK